MFLVIYLRFTSVILPLDMASFEKVCIAICLGGKRLLWKPMGNDLVYSSRGSNFITFFIFKAIDVSNVLEIDNFIKVNALWRVLGKESIESVIGALIRGCILWKEHVLAAS